jgi:hypothetical protein
VIFSAKLCFFFFYFLLAVAVSVAVCFRHAEEEDQAEWREKKKKSKAGPHVLPMPIFSQFLVRLATKIVAFFIKVADFALVGPAGPIAAVAQLFTATSMV